MENTKTAGTRVGSVGSADIATSRDKYWRELTVPEQVERMRMETKHLINRIQRVESQNYKLRKLLKSHSHLDGKIVTELSEYDNEENGLASRIGSNNSEDFYF